MANTFIFTSFAEKKFLKLEKEIQKRIKTKLQELKHHEHLESVLKTLVDFDPATHRLRVGDYRLILQKKSLNEYFILDIGNRSDIYR